MPGSGLPPSRIDDMLQTLAADTLEAAGIVLAFMRAERAALAEAEQGAPGANTDAMEAALGLNGKRVAVLAGMQVRLGRALRLTLALQQQIAAGWPQPTADGRHSGTGRRQASASARERAEAELLSDRERLEERLWDPAYEAMLKQMPAAQAAAVLERDVALIRAEVMALQAGEAVACVPAAPDAAPVTGGNDPQITRPPAPRPNGNRAFRRMMARKRPDG